MKCTLTYAKEQKILATQKQNYILDLQLSKLLEQYETCNRQSKQFMSKANNLENSAILEEMRKEMLTKNVTQLKQEENNIDKEMEIVQKKLTQIKSSNNKNKTELYGISKETEQKQRRVNRMKEECKLYKNISQSNNNIVKIWEGLKKTHENMVKNLKILEEKLKSKQRYLQILEKKRKKEEKEKQMEVKTKEKQKKQIKKELTQYTQSSAWKMRNNEKKEEENKKDGQKVKDYNALIRKKNMILLQSK